MNWYLMHIITGHALVDPYWKVHTWDNQEEANRVGRPVNSMSNSRKNNSTYDVDCKMQPLEVVTKGDSGHNRQRVSALVGLRRTLGTSPSSSRWCHTARSPAEIATARTAPRRENSTGANAQYHAWLDPRT